MSPPSDIKKVAIIGCGSIGASWAALFIAHGIQTIAYDINPSAKDFLLEIVDSALPVLSRIDNCPNKSVKSSDVLFTTDLSEALKDTDFVQENGPEKLEFKQDLFNEISRHVRNDVIIATSSSGAELLADSRRAYLESGKMRGSKTSSETISRTLAFYNHLGKKPVHVKKEARGHIANRLQGALMREMMYLIQEDICTVSDMEVAMENGPGLRWGVMGPSLLFHLAGGKGGIEHFADHLLGPAMTWYAEEDPVVNDELRSKWIAGTREVVADREFDELVRQRDDEIIELLKIRKNGQR